MNAVRTGAGSSRLDDPTAAGRAAAEAAITGLHGTAPALVLVYASMAYDLPVLLGAIRSVTGDAPLVGASSSGQFVNGALVPPGQGVSVLVLGGDAYRFGVGSAVGVRPDAAGTGQRVARAAMTAVGPDRPRYAALLVLSDGLAGDLQGLLNGVYRVVGAAVPVVGGAAAADRPLGVTYVFHDDEVITDGAVAVWIGADRPLQVVSGHGWQPNGLPMLVTGVDGPVVHEIDGRPAAEVYQENFRYEDPMRDLAVFGGAQGWHSMHAFGVIEPDGSRLVRTAYVDDTGQLCTFSPLPPFCAVQIMSGGADDLLDVTGKVAAEALAAGGAPARVLLAFSCVARLDILRDRAGEEAARLQAAAGDVPTFGFYTYGEFARSTSVSGYHNATIAALAL